MPSSRNVDDDVAEVDIAAPPDQVWDLVAEVTDRRDGEKPLVAKVFHAVMPGRGPRPRGAWPGPSPASEPPPRRRERSRSLHQRADVGAACAGPGAGRRVLRPDRHRRPDR